MTIDERKKFLHNWCYAGGIGHSKKLKKMSFEEKEKYFDKKYKNRRFLTTVICKNCNKEIQKLLRRDYQEKNFYCNMKCYQEFISTQKTFGWYKCRLDYDYNGKLFHLRSKYESGFLDILKYFNNR